VVAVLFLASAVFGQNFIQEEPDVAAARREHFIAFAKAAAANGVAWSAPVEQWSANAISRSDIPIPVGYTAEVAAERAAFFAAYNAAARAAAENPDNQQNTWDAPTPVQQTWAAPAPVQQTWSAPAVSQQRWDLPAPVGFTAEVAAERAAFFAAYNAAAKAAAENPEPEQTWSAPAPIQKAAPIPAPVQQQTWTAPASVQQTWASTPVNAWSTHAKLGEVEVDTPEVRAAKLAFFQAYNAASRAAAENPEK
jgi:hypothetical protein